MVSQCMTEFDQGWSFMWAKLEATGVESDLKSM